MGYDVWLFFVAFLVSFALIFFILLMMAVIIHVWAPAKIRTKEYQSWQFRWALDKASLVLFSVIVVFFTWAVTTSALFAVWTPFFDEITKG